MPLAWLRSAATVEAFLSSEKAAFQCAALAQIRARGCFHAPPPAPAMPTPDGFQAFFKVCAACLVLCSPKSFYQDLLVPCYSFVSHLREY